MTQCFFRDRPHHNERNNLRALGLADTPVLFVTALQSIDVSRLNLRRIHRASANVDAVVDRVILERISQHVLKDACETAGVELAWFTQHTAGVAILAGRPGQVYDINLRTIRKAGKEARETEVDRPAVLVKLGDRVGADTACLSVHTVVRQLVPSVTRAVSLRRGEGTDEELRRTLDELHTEGLRAIAAPAPNRYEEIVDAYTDIVMRLPEAWARYGQQLERDLDVSSDIFGWTFLDTLRSNAYEEVLHALSGRDRDVAQHILNFPLDVATRAVPLKAFAHARDALGTLAAYYAALLNAQHPDRDMLRSWLHGRLREYADFHIEPTITREASSLEERLRAREPMEDAFAAFANLMKVALDHDPRDLEAIAELNGEWNQLLRHWDPERQPPDPWFVEALIRERGEDDPEVRRLQDQASKRQALMELHNRLVGVRRLHRFGLCFWALRRYQATQEQEWLDAFDALAAYFSSPIELTQTLSDITQYDWDDLSPWSNWILQELPTGEAHMVSPDFNVTYAVLMIRSLSPTEDVPELLPDRRLGIHFKVEEPIKLVERVLADPKLNDALPDSPEDRAGTLVEALDAMVAAADILDEDATISASLSDALTDEFEAKVQESWNQGRFLRRAFGHTGSIQLEDGDPPPTARHAVSAWQSKGLFLEGEARVHGHDHTARELAAALGREEMKKALHVMGASSLPDAPEDDPAAQLRRVLAEMRASGLDPQLILMPSEWRLLAEAWRRSRSGVGWHQRGAHMATRRLSNPVSRFDRRRPGIRAHGS